MSTDPTVTIPRSNRKVEEIFGVELGRLYNRPPAYAKSKTTGVDWQQVSLGLQADAFCNDLRIYDLGQAEDILPSGKWYTSAQVGEVATLREAIADFKFMRVLREEAAAFGFRVTVPADMAAGRIFIECDVLAVFPVGGGRYILTEIRQ